MEVYVEDITEDYGGHGVSVYSLVRGMDTYTGEVRASGVEIYDKNDELVEEYDPELEQELKEALTKEIYKEYN